MRPAAKIRTNRISDGKCQTCPSTPYANNLQNGLPGCFDRDPTSSALVYST